MKGTGRAVLALTLALCVGGGAQANSPAGPQPVMPAVPAVSVDAAAWLAGRWVGEGLGGTVEEVWSPPSGGQMVGHFSLVRDGKPVFYEIMLIDVHEGGLRMRVKHFHPDFVGWEEKDGWHSFDPVSAAPGDLRLNGLWMRLEKDELVSTVSVRDRVTGQVVDQVLRHRRLGL